MWRPPPRQQHRVHRHRDLAACHRSLSPFLGPCASTVAVFDGPQACRTGRPLLLLPGRAPARHVLGGEPPRRQIERRGPVRAAIAVGSVEDAVSSPPATVSIREPHRARCMARAAKRGVWESHSFCAISAPALLSILACGSLPRSKKAQGLRAAAKSPQSKPGDGEDARRERADQARRTEPDAHGGDRVRNRSCRARGHGLTRHQVVCPRPAGASGPASRAPTARQVSPWSPLHPAQSRHEDC